MGLTRVNLALAGVVALLALAALFGPDPALDEAPEPLTALDPAAVQRIRIDRGGEDTLTFQRDADGWRMTAPYQIAAEWDKLQALARIASTPSHRSFPVAEADPAELGLAPAPLRLALDSLTLEIGGTEPIRRRRYVRREGRIHLIDDLFQHHLLAAAAAFAKRRPFPNAIHSATLDGAPLGPKALPLLGKVQARSVESGEPPQEGHRLEIRIEGSKSPLGFRLGNQGERLWREQPPLLYLLDAPLTPDLLQD